LAWHDAGRLHSAPRHPGEQLQYTSAVVVLADDDDDDKPKPPTPPTPPRLLSPPAVVAVVVATHSPCTQRMAQSARATGLTGTSDPASCSDARSDSARRLASSSS
jgi:hypothetical protein